MKFKTSENTCKKSLSLISPLFTTSWIYLGPRFWIPTKVSKASLEGSSVPISIWLGVILSSNFFLPSYSPAQCHGLPAGEFRQECSCPWSSLLSTNSRYPWLSQSWRGQPASSPHRAPFHLNSEPLTARHASISCCITAASGFYPRSSSVGDGVSKEQIPKSEMHVLS